MDIYFGGRQVGKTTMLIRKSAETRAVIAVPTTYEAEYINWMAKNLGFEIPSPVPYIEMFGTLYRDPNRRYLVDELQVLLRDLKIDVATIDPTPMNIWKLTPGGVTLLKGEGK